MSEKVPRRSASDVASPLPCFSRIPFMVLNPENFNRVTKGHIPTIVRFYSAHRQGSLALDE
jgi:hypothetical protein